MKIIFFLIFNLIYSSSPQTTPHSVNISREVSYLHSNKEEASPPPQTKKSKKKKSKKRQIKLKQKKKLKSVQKQSKIHALPLLIVALAFLFILILGISIGIALGLGAIIFVLSSFIGVIGLFLIILWLMIVRRNGGFKRAGSKYEKYPSREPSIRDLEKF